MWNRTHTLIAGGLLLIATAHGAQAAEFIETEVLPFGTFKGTEYVQYKGRFQGATELGEFDVPFEFVAPADPAAAEGTAVFEPPHFGSGPLMRELVLGPRLLFKRGFTYVAVGFGGNGLNVLDPAAGPIIIGGEPVAEPGAVDPLNAGDEGIMIQFVEAVRADPFATARLGATERVYAVGNSQTSEALLNLSLGAQAQGLIELYVLTGTLWEPAFIPVSVFTRVAGAFDPAEVAGRMLFVAAEGDLLVSNSEQLRNSVGDPDTRLYQVAGAAHTPLTGAFGIRDQLPFRANGLDWSPVARAVVLAGHDWVRAGIEPPHDRVFATTEEVDPVYDMVTGIARDENLNARGGVRLPNVQTGRFQYVASLLDFAPPGGVPGLIGSEIDLECEPLPDGSVRFRHRGSYDWPFAWKAITLVSEGLLLRGDAIGMIFDARAAEVGAEGRCDESG